MGKLSYALEKGQPKRLEISWKWDYSWGKDITIKLDGQEIGRIPGTKELKEGRSFTLEKDAILKVQMVNRFNDQGYEIRVLINGQPVPGSSSDAGHRLILVCGALFFIAGFDLLLGLIAELYSVKDLLKMGLGTYSVIFGSLLGITGFIVWKRHSSIALGLAIVVQVIYGIMGWIAGGPNAMAVHIFFIIPMFRGFSAITELNEQNKSRIPVS